MSGNTVYYYTTLKVGDDEQSIHVPINIDSSRSPFLKLTTCLDCCPTYFSYDPFSGNANISAT